MKGKELIDIVTKNPNLKVVVHTKGKTTKGEDCTFYDADVVDAYILELSQDYVDEFGEVEHIVLVIDG